MRVSTGSATTKKKLTIRRRSRKAKKPNVKDSKSRPRRKNRKSANVEENQNSAEINIKRVIRLFGDASTEELPESEADANIFQDIDLLILGSSTEEYKTYTHLLRKEYSHLDDASYKKMRLKILQTFLTIPTIYLTSDFHNRFEDIARKNVTNEIEELKK